MLKPANIWEATKGYRQALRLLVGMWVHFHYTLTITGMNAEKRTCTIFYDVIYDVSVCRIVVCFDVNEWDDGSEPTHLSEYIYRGLHHEYLWMMEGRKTRKMRISGYRQGRRDGMYQSICPWILCCPWILSTRWWNRADIGIAFSDSPLGTYIHIANRLLGSAYSWFIVWEVPRTDPNCSA